MLSFIRSYILLILQHLLLHLTMPSIKKTMEKVMGPSPGQRVKTLQEELTRIREEGAMVRQMMSQIIEERAAREADLERMRIAGLLSGEELEVMYRAEERLRRGGMFRENSVRFTGRGGCRWLRPTG